MKTMNKFIVNGNEVNAYYSSNDINDVLIPLLKAPLLQMNGNYSLIYYA